MSYFLKVLYKNEPETFPIPTVAQIKFLKSNARFQVLVAASRFGKSMWASVKVAARMVFLPRFTGKSLRCWVVAPTYQLSEKEFRWVRLALLAFGEKLVKDHYSGNTMYLELENGSSLKALTVGNKTMRNLLGEEVDDILFSEFSQNTNQEELWDRYALRALMSRLGSAYFPSTPAGYTFFREIYERGQSKDKIWKHYESFGPYNSYEGGGVSKEEFIQAYNTLVKEAFEEQWLGLFVLYTGRVFKEFREIDHVYDEKREKSLLKRSEYCNYNISIGCDWGIRNKTAFVFVAEINQIKFVFDEIYESDLLTDDIIRVVNKKLEYWGIGQNFMAYADHDLRLRKELAQKGFWVENARKFDKARAIMHLRQQFKNNKLFISERCVNLRNEVGQYHYPDGKDGENPSELPVKYNDHAIDALQYVIWTPRADLWSKKEREGVK